MKKAFRDYRCPKCLSGKIGYVGEIIGHREVKGRWVSRIVQKMYDCKSCEHMWAKFPDQQKGEE